MARQPYIQLSRCPILWQSGTCTNTNTNTRQDDKMKKLNTHKYKNKYKYISRWQNDKVEHAQLQKKHKYISICPIQGQMWDKWCTAGTNMLVRMVQMLQCQMTGFPILRKCYVTGMNVVMADYWTSWFVDEQDCLFKMLFGCLLMWILSWTAFGRLVNYGDSGLVDKHTGCPKKSLR